MATYEVDFEVTQSYWKCLSKEKRIGTSGCGPCVGVIAINSNGEVFCGHMDCELSHEKKTEIATAAKSLMNQHVGDMNSVKSKIYIASQMSDVTAKYMIEAIKTMYGKDNVVFWRSDMIYWDGSKAVECAWNDDLSGGNKGPSDLKGPFKIK